MELVTRFNIALLFLGLGMFFSCKKEEDRTCFKSIGGESALEIKDLKMDKLYLKSKVKYVFIQDSLDRIVVRGGKNLINHIAFEYDNDSILHVSNKNKCKFLRKMNSPISVEFHFSKLSYIEVNSGDSIVSRGVIKVPFLKVEIADGASSIRLNVDVDSINTYARYGFTDITYSGKTKMCNANITYATAYNILDLNISQASFIRSATSQSIYVNANNIALTGEIWSNGNVYYKGTPGYLDFNVKAGNGKLIKIE